MAEKIGNTGEAVGGVAYSMNGAAAEFAAFDRLPPEVRAALRDTRFELNSEDVLKELRRRNDIGGLVNDIREFDEYMLQQAYAERGYTDAYYRPQI